MQRQRDLLEWLSGTSRAEVPARIYEWLSLDDVAENPESFLGPDIGRVAVITLVALAVRDQPHAAAAAVAYPWATRCADLTATWNPGVAMLGSTHLYAAHLAFALGERNAGVSHLKRAIEQNDRLGARPFLAIALHDLANVLDADTADAIAARNRGAHLATELGMDWLNAPRVSREPNAS